MSKFKVGDVVVGTNKSDSRYAITTKKGGFVGKVTDVYSDECIEVKILKHNNPKTIGHIYDVNSHYFELEHESNKPTNKCEIHITVNGNITHAVLKENGTVTKRAEAKCSPEDIFDFKVGAQLAFERLLELDGTEPIEEKKEPFVPHLRATWNNEHLGAIGELSPFKDMFGRALCVGDVVELFDEWGDSHGMVSIVHTQREGFFVMSIQFNCEQDGTIKDWKIWKKRSYKDVKNGEIIDDVKYITEEE